MQPLPRRLIAALVLLVALAAAWRTADAQGAKSAIDHKASGHIAATQSKSSYPRAAEYMETIHYLLAHHKDIQRSVNIKAGAVHALTESHEPGTAHMIQRHVAEMKKLMQGCAQGVCPKRAPGGIDPVFIELAKNARKVHMKVEYTPRGVAVVETGDTAYVQKLLAYHSTVVTDFVKYGMPAAMAAHIVPGSKLAADASAPSKKTTG